jgi:hypothetical protein
MAAEAEELAAHADRLDALGLDAARQARELSARWNGLVQELTPARPSRDGRRSAWSGAGPSAPGEHRNGPLTGAR